MSQYDKHSAHEHSASWHREVPESATPKKSGFRVEPGTRIGDFEMVRILGRGGMGEVWEAQQLSLQRRVALKLLLPERVSEKGLDFFAREARAAREVLPRQEAR